MAKISDFMQNHRKNSPMIAAHRGSSAGNIPFNTFTSFDAALYLGADIIETDVTKVKDDKLIIFHPGKEDSHLAKDIELDMMTVDEIRKERYVNFDNDLTTDGIPTLEEALRYLKGRCLINLDHCWKYIPETVECVRRVGVEDQIILKTPANEQFFKLVEEYAPDIMYMPMIKTSDDCSEMLENMNINYIGAEVIFSDENAQVASEEYIESQHRKGRILWSNAIIYSYEDQLTAGHSDDVSIVGNPESGWGWLIDRKFDIIQTDWVGALRDFIKNR